MIKKTARLTIVATTDVEASLRAMKKELYYDRTQSQMIRDLVQAGIRSTSAEKKGISNRRA